MTENLVIKPQQKRSKQSLERLINASANQIASGNFDTVSVAEIAKQAKCSVGTFYGRFQNKAALFHVVQDRVFDTTMNFLNTKIDEFTQRTNASPALPSDTTAKAITFAVDLAIAFYGENRGIFRAVFLHTRTLQDPVLMNRVREFNAAGMKASMRILKTTEAEPNAAHKKLWREGLEIILVYLRESILFGDPVATDKAHDLTAMRAAAINMLTAYMAGSNHA